MKPLHWLAAAIAVVAFLGIVQPTPAQTPVQQQGNVATGNCATWVGNRLVKDSGALCSFGQITQTRPGYFLLLGTSWSTYALPVASGSSSTSGGYGQNASGAMSGIGDMLSYMDGRLREHTCDQAVLTNGNGCFDTGQTGQTLRTIIAAEISTLIPALEAAGWCPDQILAPDILLNSINGGESVAGAQADVMTFITLNQQVCPGTKLLISTIPPDGRNAGIPTPIANWQIMNAWLPTLDDGKKIFVTNMSGLIVNGGVGPQTGWQDPANPGQPYPGWTYLSTQAEALTRADGVHMRQNAASVFGAQWVATELRAGGLAGTQLPFISPNLFLTGSVSCGNGKFSGTCPTAVGAQASPSGTNATVVGTAGGTTGGANFVFTPDSVNTPNDQFMMRLTGTNVAPSPQPYAAATKMVIRINSGSSSIGLLDSRGLITSNCTAQYNLYMPYNVVNPPTVLPKYYYDGEIITLQSTFAPYPTPACVATAWDLDLIINSTNTKNPAEPPINITVLSWGWTPDYGSPQLLPFPATTASLGGSLLAAGACSSTTTTVAGATTGNVVTASPVTYPGDGNYWYAYVSTANTVTTEVCAAIAGTPTASAYNIRVNR